MIGAAVRQGVTAVGLCLGLACAAIGAQAQEVFTALTSASNTGSVVSEEGANTVLTLHLGQPVAFRVFTLSDPMRLIVDFSEVDWAGFDTQAFDRSEAVLGLRVGLFRSGWSRMVIDLDVPLQVKTAQMTRGASDAVLRLVLSPTDVEQFVAKAGAPEAAQFARVARPASDLARSQTPSGPMVVMLDPGHGGIDPGAERDGLKEADLMLTFAQELRDTLVRAGGFEVVLTRDDDSFVPLEARITRAHEAGADVFISLHADAISEGRAEGATVYTLADRASDEASRKLAERHDRADILSGVDLSDQDDVIAGVLLDMARTETQPRTDAFANALVAALESSVGMHKRPRLEAGFSVLKSADIPSVLLELGFLSSNKDRANLDDPVWRDTAAQAIRDALVAWQQIDRAAMRQLRK